MQVQMSDYFKEAYPNFGDGVRQAVARFIDHAENYGVKGLQGRNKSSADLTDTTKKGRERAKFAQKYCLWHYHLGVPFYIEHTNGDLTSEYILHYCYYDAFNNGRLVGVLATLATTILMFGLVPLQALFWAGFLFLIITNLIIFGRNLL